MEGEREDGYGEAMLEPDEIDWWGKLTGEAARKRGGR